MTALHIASRCGREEVVDVLLQSEAFTEVNAITKVFYRSFDDRMFILIRTLIL